MENMPDNVKDNPVGKREALLADRLRLHKGYRNAGVKIFSKGDFMLGMNWFEGEVTVGDVAEFFQRSGDTLYDKLGAEWPHASAVNGIYPEDVADLPTIETAIPRLREIFAGADEVIGYNVGFDLGFLSAVGVRPREDARITDTMKEFTWFMGRRYKLVDAADHIGYEWTGRAHGSLADALATLAVQRWLEQWLVAE